jgi:hypothetical protein
LDADRAPQLKAIVMLLLVMTALVLFEVMDKEPSLAVIWVSSLFLGIGGLLLSRYKWWMATTVIAIALVLALDQILELRDPFVGPDIVREASYSYVFQSYLAAAFSIVLPSLGLIMKWKRSG